MRRRWDAFVRRVSNRTGDELSQKPSIGRIVHYVLPSGPSRGEHRPGIIVRVWPESETYGGTVQLQVFTDNNAQNGFYNDQLPCPLWATSVKYDESGTEGTWHFPERVD